MKKVFKLQDLDCANCARKMEDAIKKIDGVQDASVSFMTQKMTLAEMCIRDRCGAGTFRRPSQKVVTGNAVIIGCPHNEIKSALPDSLFVV